MRVLRRNSEVPEGFKEAEDGPLPPNGFKETELGPIPVDWEVARLAWAEIDAGLDAVMAKLGFEMWQEG